MWGEPTLHPFLSTRLPVLIVPPAGILQIIQHLSTLSRHPTPTLTDHKQHALTLLQCYSMLAYYPFEYLSYLSLHRIIPDPIPLPFLGFRSIGSAALGVWSCRFWALYVLLQLERLREEWKALDESAHRNSESKGKHASEARRRDKLVHDTIANIAYLPLTINW